MAALFRRSCGVSRRAGLGVAGEVGVFGEWAWAGDWRGRETAGGEPWCGRSVPQALWSSRYLTFACGPGFRTQALISGPPPPLTLGQDTSQVLLGICPLHKWRPGFRIYFYFPGLELSTYFLQ